MVWNVRIDVETNNYTVDYESTLPSFGVGSANAIAGGVIDCLAGSGVGALRLRDVVDDSRDNGKHSTFATSSGD